jgi:hypothetical protein
MVLAIRARRMFGSHPRFCPPIESPVIVGGALVISLTRGVPTREVRIQGEAILRGLEGRCQPNETDNFFLQLKFLLL